MPPLISVSGVQGFLLKGLTVQLKDLTCQNSYLTDALTHISEWCSRFPSVMQMLEKSDRYLKD